MANAPNKFPYRIIDAHHHFWDLEKVHYPWLATKGIVRFFGDPAPIQKNYLVDDLREDAGHLPLQKSVHIQVGADDSQHLLEAQTIQALCDQHGLGNAIVAFAQLESPTVNNALDQLEKLSRFRGIRQIVGRSPEEDKQTGTGTLLNNPAWLEGLNELARRDLSFDLQLIPEQMMRAVEVVSKVPELQVAICHCGSPWYREHTNPQGWELWKAGLQALSNLPNTVCKVSGLSMFDHHWTSETLAPIIHHVLDCFGPNRVMFGSNFPVDKLHTSYTALWLAYQEILESHPAALSTVNIQGMFADNCTEFYRL